MESLTLRELITLAQKTAIDLGEQKLVTEHIEGISSERPQTKEERYRAAVARGAKVVKSKKPIQPI